MLATTTGAVSLKGNRMKMINATALDRKSGGAQWRGLCVDVLSWKCFSLRANPDFLFGNAGNDHVCGSL
jgi:hypothetical protein